MTVTVQVEIGTEGPYCWRCQFAPSFIWCSLFQKRLTRPDDGAALKRCAECVAAEANIKEQEKYMIPENKKQKLLKQWYGKDSGAEGVPADEVPGR